MIGVRRGSGARKRGVALLAGLAALLGLVPAPSSGQRIGLFFDPAGTLCQAPIAYFDSVRVYVVGFPPADSLLIGAFLSLERPPDLEIYPGTFRTNKQWVNDVIGDQVKIRDLDVRFKNCVQFTEPVPLLEFVVWEKSPVLRSDLTLRLVGGPVDSLQQIQQPAWKVCDPLNLEGFSSLVTAPSVNAVFNCTRACYCTTAVHNRTWSFVKSLYQGN